MSFQQGVTGLTAAGRNLEVIGNNVANASTVGAKASRAEFADIYARASGGSASAGLGVSVTTVAQQFSQGSISSTDNALDVAINGAGFFQLQDANGATVYSRNGQFKVDNDGYVTNNEGLKLLAVPTNLQAGQVAGSAAALKLPTKGIEPDQTTQMTLEINLDSRKAVTTGKVDSSTGATLAIDYADASTYNNSTSINIYDGQGSTVAMTYFFQKTAENNWNIYATANGKTVGGSTNDPQPIATATFPAPGTPPTITPYGSSTPATDGKLVVSDSAIGVGTFADSSDTGSIEMDFSGLTQFGATFGPTNVSQNGTAPGKLTSISISADGTVVGAYSSGQSQSIARIELSNFRNPQGLTPLGGNMWASTYESGGPITGMPGGGNMGQLQSKSLEESNVDLTQELVNMMVAQRIYQANAQTIKTQDSVMQTLVSLR